MAPSVVLQRSGSRWILPPGAFRIVLAFLVVVTHSLPLKLGPGAVFVFFMLSGYWIDVMWHREYEQTSAPWRVFIVSRLWRLLPVYFLSLVLYVAVCLVFSIPILPALTAPIERLHFYFSNLFILGLVQLPPASRIVYPAWSLDIELQFYIIAPAIIALLVSRKSLLYFLGLAAIAMCFGGYYLVYNEGLRAFSGIMPMYLIFFLIGLGTARYGWQPSDRTANLSLLAGAGFFVLIIAFHQTRGLFIAGPFMSPIRYYSPAANFMLAMLLAPYAMATVRVNAKARGGFAAATDRHLSNLTYEVYLLHASVITGFNALMLGTPRLRQLPFVPVAYLVILLLSLIVYRYYDQPIDQKRRDFVRLAARKLPLSTLRLPQSEAMGERSSSPG
jgi:peptidoglycan/LPS O-acetylase OafA/YrhL